MAKPLLLESLGRPFLAYILGADEGEIDEWLTSTTETFGTEQQSQALHQLISILYGARDEDNPLARRLNLSLIFGTYHEPFRTTLANAIRAIATNRTTHADGAGSLTEMLGSMARDAYPLYLLPEDQDFPSIQPSLYQHPLRERFEAAVMDDEVLSRIFTRDEPNSGKIGSLIRSTGQGGGVQLSTFASTLIGSGWRMARMANVSCPSADAHVEVTLNQLNIIRDALAGKTVEVPARVAFTGVTLASDQPLNLGWGILRKTDDRDSHLTPRFIEGQLSGTGADGTSVTVNYGGDVLLDTTIGFQVAHHDFKPEEEWPKELRAFDRIGRLVESVQLGALLSQEYSTTEPITVLPTWHYIHDPFAHGYNLGINDPRMSRTFMPKQLNESEGAQWKKFAILVEQARTKHIDVAIRRTLRAAAERKDHVDVLVDAVIAWENLVGSQKGEPTLRVSGSLAWLLEDDLLKRMERRRELVKLYSLRSNVVHGNEMLPDRDLVLKAQRAMELTVKSLRILFTERQDLLKECKNGDERSNRLLMGG